MITVYTQIIHIIIKSLLVKQFFLSYILNIFTFRIVLFFLDKTKIEELFYNLKAKLYLIK